MLLKTIRFFLNFIFICLTTKGKENAKRQEPIGAPPRYLTPHGKPVGSLDSFNQKSIPYKVCKEEILEQQYKGTFITRDLDK